MATQISDCRTVRLAFTVLAIHLGNCRRASRVSANSKAMPAKDAFATKEAAASNDLPLRVG